MSSSKRQYEILNNSTDKPVRQITVDGHKVKLRSNGYGVVVDEGLAREIDARYGYRSKERTGGQVVVVPVDDRDYSKPKGYAQYTGGFRPRYRTKAEREAAERSDHAKQD